MASTDSTSRTELLSGSVLVLIPAAKVGVPDYRDLVEQKLKTAEELHQYMVEQFNQARGFFLEVVVVLILLIELVFLFRSVPS